jgi:hypothetical protein
VLASGTGQALYWQFSLNCRNNVSRSAQLLLHVGLLKLL